MAATVIADADRAQRAASLLLDARRLRQSMHAILDDVRPRSAADAYAIQDAVIERLGAVGGWKVGAKSPTAEPTCAPLPAALIFPSPQRFAAGTFAHNGVEGELAFTLARDLPSRDTPYLEQEMHEAIATVHPAIEVVDSRFADIGATDAWSLLADFQSNGALVLGEGRTWPRTVDPPVQSVRVRIDGRDADATPGRNPAGSLLRLLAWLASHAARRGRPLRRGDVVTTGSWTGMRFHPAGTRIDVEFSGIGGVQLAF